MAHIDIYVNLFTRIRAVRPSTSNVLRNAFGHLIRALHYMYFQTLGWIGFIYGLMIGMGPKFFSVPYSPSTHGLKVKSRTWKFIVEVYSC